MNKYLDFPWDRPLLANLYMNKLEENFKMSPSKPEMLMLYLDDYFALWSHGIEKLKELMKFGNQIDEKIKFTIEIEEGERLRFLDVEVIRSNVQKEVICRYNTQFPVPLQPQAKDKNEEDVHQKHTNDGCGILE
ncbi:unnamed protein product [Protopolystoma xenopodis]|uniref:Reverse transcriptase domain-containing protein n=1 Tax=Protopolystoma xenopodis TaxID=117903 RepID=A0A448WHD5_9PLAT|nr:unnamed protein product [Protopolystoma xenopodis]